MSRCHRPNTLHWRSTQRSLTDSADGGLCTWRCLRCFSDFHFLHSEASSIPLPFTERVRDDTSLPLPLPCSLSKEVCEFCTGVGAFSLPSVTKLLKMRHLFLVPFCAVRCGMLAFQVSLSFIFPSFLTSTSVPYTVLASSCTCCSFHTSHIFSCWFRLELFTILPFFHQTVKACCVLQGCIHLFVLFLLSLPA